MTQAETITYNRKACENPLMECRREFRKKAEALPSQTLNDTPFGSIEALVWAYRRIEELEKQQ